MNTYFKRTAVATSIIAMSSVAAAADTISFVSITNTTDFNSTVGTDTEINGDASITGVSTSVAVQNADGTSEVEASTGGGFGRSLVTSTAQFAQSETNLSGADRDYTLSYDLTGQSADFDLGFEVFQVAAASLSAPAVIPTVPTNPLNPFLSSDPADLPTDFTQFSGASFEYNIEVNGVLVFNARADALLNGFSPFGGPVIDVESNFNSSITSTSTGFTFAVDAIADDIFLGTFSDGEDIDVVSYLTARAYTPGNSFDGFGIGVNAFSSDPINLSSIGALSSVASTTTPPVSTVPLPAAGWLLMAGIGGLAAARRRKS